MREPSTETKKLSPPSPPRSVSSPGTANEPVGTWSAHDLVITVAAFEITADGLPRSRNRIDRNGHDLACLAEGVGPAAAGDHVVAAGALDLVG